MTEDGDGRKIFIAKIKLGTLENEVLDVCKKLDVGNVDAITFRLARKGTFGFAEFATAEDANKAIEELDGYRDWKVQLALYRYPAKANNFKKQYSPSRGGAAGAEAGLSWVQREAQRRAQFAGAGNTNDKHVGYAEGKRERETYAGNDYRERDRERERDEIHNDDHSTRRGFRDDIVDNEKADDDTMRVGYGVEDVLGRAGDRESDREEQPRLHDANRHTTNKEQDAAEEGTSLKHEHGNGVAAKAADSRDDTMDKATTGGGAALNNVNNWRSGESDTPRSGADKSNVGSQLAYTSNVNLQDCEDFDEDAYRRERMVLDLKFARHKRMKRIREIESEMQKLQDEKTRLQGELDGGVDMGS